MGKSSGRRWFLKSVAAAGAAVPAAAWGADPHSHDGHLFIIGASAFPQNGGYNPTDTVGALTY
jgi:hypothetical protein